MSKSTEKLDSFLKRRDYTEDEIFDSQCPQSTKQRLADMFDFAVNVRKIPLEMITMEN